MPNAPQETLCHPTNEEQTTVIPQPPSLSHPREPLQQIEIPSSDPTETITISSNNPPVRIRGCDDP